MTDPDERTINRAICLLDDEHQTEREEARAALHRMFRRVRRHEAHIEQLEAALNEIAEELSEQLRSQPHLAHSSVALRRARAAIAKAKEETI